jgi:hypothetical protein
VFKRVSLTGSAELFRETLNTSEVLAETDPEPAPIHHLPVQLDIRPEQPAPETNGVAHFDYQLTEPQVRALIDAVQKLKYPHTVKNAAKLSMEEFERLEALRQLLLDGLR